VGEGRFRSDLYYRLNVLPLHVPALRHRTEDIPELAEFFLKRFARDTKKQVVGFTSEAIESLLTYSWPGNVRELENAIERAVVISTDAYIRPEDLILQQPGDKDRYTGKTLKESTSLFKKHFIESTLRSNEWNQTAAAKQLGIQRTYLSRLIKELDISK
jgi:Nif-specific regulatory protein